MIGWCVLVSSRQVCSVYRCSSTNLGTVFFVTGRLIFVADVLFMVIRSLYSALSAVNGCVGIVVDGLQSLCESLLLLLLCCGTIRSIGCCDLDMVDHSVMDDGLYFQDPQRDAVERYKKAMQEFVTNTLKPVPIHDWNVNGFRERCFDFLIGFLSRLRRCW